MDNVINIEKQIKALQDRKKTILASNKAFAAMTPAAKRVAIAKDALEQINKGLFNPRHGAYVEFYESIEVKDNNQELCSLIEDKGCNVCARGALFLSTVRKFDNFSVSKIDKYDGTIDSIGQYEFKSYESNFFDRKQIRMIECMFECNSDHANVKDSKKMIDAAVTYGESFHYSKDRLKEICKNIIRNNGEFIIPKKFFYEESED